VNSACRSHLRLGHLRAAQAAMARSSVAVAARLPGAADPAHAAFAAGLHLALLAAAVIVLAAAL
jgi:hypothetical protein